MHLNLTLDCIIFKEVEKKMSDRIPHGYLEVRFVVSRRLFTFSAHF